MNLYISTSSESESLQKYTKSVIYYARNLQFLTINCVVVGLIQPIVDLIY